MAANIGGMAMVERNILIMVVRNCLVMVVSNGSESRRPSDSNDNGSKESLGCVHAKVATRQCGAVFPVVASGARL